ncbi:MAG: STAS domain-containing protein [Oscillospiraceae bacterium]|nr:STAS domain-containing protein [Oscillospiraceae bacterium]
MRPEVKKDRIREEYAKKCMFFFVKHFSMKLLLFRQRKYLPNGEYIYVGQKGGVWLKVIYNNVDKVLVIEITEEIDHHTTNRIRSRADFEIEKNMPKKVIFDFDKVTFMDSSGIGMLIGRYKLVSMFRRRDCNG